MLILTAAMLMSATAADAPSDPKVAFRECIKHVDMLDPNSDGVTKCLKAYGAAPPKDELTDVDPLAKKVADDESYKYLLVSTADANDPIGKCTQASLTAQAYLNAKMPYKYNSWKSIEDRDCKAAGVR